MKRFVVMSMILLLSVSFCACGKNKNPAPSTTTPTTQTSEMPTILPDMDTNIPDPSVDTSMTNFTEDMTTK